AVGLAGTIFMPHFASNWHLMAALYTIGLAHLGSQLSGHELASANAAFVLCYGVGMVLGPQAIGVGMDIFGPSGFGWSLGLFFAAYIALVGVRLIRKVL
ncbi:MAG: MFS transporter, partial [Mesorhizobium sp.]